MWFIPIYILIITQIIQASEVERDHTVVTSGTNTFQRSVTICMTCNAHLKTEPSGLDNKTDYWIPTRFSKTQNGIKIEVQGSSDLTSVYSAHIRNPLFTIFDQCFVWEGNESANDRYLVQRNCEQNLGYECESNQLIVSHCPVESVCDTASSTSAEKDLLLSNSLCLDTSRSLYDPRSSFNRGSRIINGQDTTIENHPWAVYLTFQSRDNPDAWFKCGGTIVSPTRVITAKHCVDKTDFGYILVGTANKSEVSDPNGTRIEFDTSDIQLHPDPNIDVGALEFVDLTLYTAPTATVAPLPVANTSQALKPTDQLTVIGWGVTCRDPPACTIQDGDPDILQEVQITVQSDASCNNNALYQFCAGGITNGIPMDSCSGDSGSPGECLNSDGTKRFCGIVSEGPEQCGFNPGTYIQVADESVRWFVLNTEQPKKSGSTRSSMVPVAVQVVLFTAYSLTLSDI